MNSVARAVAVRVRPKPVRDTDHAVLLPGTPPSSGTLSSALKSGVTVYALPIGTAYGLIEVVSHGRAREDG